MAKLLVQKEDRPEYIYGHLIPLGRGLCALVDYIDYFTVRQWRWKARKSSHIWYAVRNEYLGPQEIQIKMHRFIMMCPAGREVHHKNHCSLDNRRSNLLIVDPEIHRQIHKNSNLSGDPAKKEEA